MRVNPDKFYVATRFHRHEKVKFIAAWANEIPKMYGVDSAYNKVAKRIKSLVIKRYRIGTVLIPLCKEWEEAPWDFANWLNKYTKGYRVTLVPGSKEYSPSTIRMHYV